MPKYLEMSAEVVVDIEALFGAKSKQQTKQSTEVKTEIKEEVKDIKDQLMEDNAMGITELILTIASIITALGIITGAVFSGYRWYLKQNEFMVSQHA